MRPLALALVTVLSLSCSGKSKGPDPDDQKPDGEVIEVDGEVTAQRGGSADVRTLTKHAQVFGNDAITTGKDAAVKIRLLHNDAVWSLGGSMKRRLSETGAWKASKGKAGVFDEASGSQTAAAGRHAEKQGADTRATVEKDNVRKPPTRSYDSETPSSEPTAVVPMPDSKGGAGNDTKAAKHPEETGGKGEELTRSRVTYRSQDTLAAKSSKRSMEAFSEKLQKSYSRGIRVCHERALATNLDAVGTISIELDIGKDGAVVEARLKGFDEEISACILAKAKTWRFEPAKDESGAPVATTLRFSIELKAE